MATQWCDDDARVDSTVHCGNCDAVCCRLTVLVTPQDNVPDALVVINERGLAVMDRGEQGWCIALDMQSMRCGIYDSRPDTCRRFTMGSGYCRDERAMYEARHGKRIPLAVID